MTLKGRHSVHSSAALNVAPTPEQGSPTHIPEEKELSLPLHAEQTQQIKPVASQVTEADMMLGKGEGPAPCPTLTSCELGFIYRHRRPSVLSPKREQHDIPLPRTY